VVYNDWYIRKVTQKFSRFIHLFRIKPSMLKRN